MPINLQFEGGYNFRDLGETTTQTGQVTKKGIFIRSGGLDKLSLAAQEQLLDYGVRTIVDLRSEWECQNFPNVFAQSKSIQYKNLPMMNDELSNSALYKAKTQNYEHLGEVYCAYLEICQKPIGKIISALAESPAGTVFHCYAGKDRTGIVAALLLSIVGVADAEIASDYAETNVQIQHLAAEWRANAIKEGRDVAKQDRDAAAEPATILTTLNHIRQNYDSVEDYLQICGLDNSQLEAIKLRFI